MAKQESKKHHFVPRFLLRPWLVERPPGQRVLLGYSWDNTKRGLSCKVRGVAAFCTQLDLLTLSAHRLGRDAIERIFFGEIDTKGAVARDILLTRGPNALGGDQRCHFARLLLSLEARRRNNVIRLRNEGKNYLASKLDADSEILAALTELGVNEMPSSYVEGQLDWSLEDRALTIVQELVDDPKVGGRLINANWGVKRLGNYDGSIIISDRPLIRVHGYDRPGATWVLPLSPNTCFIACNHQSNLSKLMGLSGQRFVKAVNVSSAAQAERFVFCSDRSHEHWLKKHLKPKA